MDGKSFSNRRYLDALAQRVLIFGGAMGTSVQRYDLDAEAYGSEQYWGCIDYLTVTRPDVIAEIHSSFLDAGADIIVTDTFRANRITLREYGLQDRVAEINRAAAQLARQISDKYSTPKKPRFVAGSVGPSGMLPSADDPTLSNITFDELADVFREQAVDLIRGGCDLLLVQIKAGGVGLNMQAASAALIIEPQLNPAVEYQAICRVHRMGQRGTVNVHRLVSIDTIEEGLMQMLARKRQYMDDYARDSLLKNSSAEAISNEEVQQIMHSQEARLRQVLAAS